MSKVIIRVLIEQKKYTSNERELIKHNETQTVNHKGFELPKIGGVVEDNSKEVLGYVFDERLYDNEGNRKLETMLPYDWTRFDSYNRLTNSQLEQYSVRKPVLV